MNFLTRIAVLFYVIIVMFICSFVLLFVLNYIDVRDVLETISFIYWDENLRMVFGSISGALLFFNYLFYRLFTVGVYRDHAIAFDNPSGRVSVSLMAIEDLVRRAIGQVREVKEVKSKITASKKGLQVRARLVMRSEGRIPEITSRVQEMVKRKVQEAIGLDEPIDVTIYVGKILPDLGREKFPVQDEEPQKETERNIPFQGYRA